MTRRAFTLVELLVVIAIIGVLIATMLPAISGCREAARRAECSQQLGRLSLALHQYESAQLYFPPAGWNDSPTIVHEPTGRHLSWTVTVLPFLDRQDMFSHVKLDESAYAAANENVRLLSVGPLRCPSDASSRHLKYPASSYAACYDPAEQPIAEDSAGALVLNHPLQRDDYTDGMAYTLFLGEKRSDLTDLGWMSATRSTLRNTGHLLNSSFLDPNAKIDDKFVGGFGSAHTSGTLCALGDGHVRFLSEQIGAIVLQRLGNRSDGELLSDDEF
jgi:prepilin-type N-terminal cleavage/methylation domain-containing protein